MRALLLIAVISLSSCGENWTCHRVFDDGEIVAHRILSGRYVVARSSETKNLEGFCIVDVRGEDGRMVSMSVTELKKL